MKRWSVIFILVFLTLFVSGQEKRIAIVIGNENYLNSMPLYNPANDANAMEAVLQAAGFRVYKYIDLDRESMLSAFDNFGENLHNYDVGLVFYAGHGIQADGINYLIPVDARLTSIEDVRKECVEAQLILNNMETANAETNIIILDACRDNPFERSWNRSASVQGLAFMNAPEGSIIAYATSPGRAASDGLGKNGLYTSALLEFIQVPGLKIEEVFKEVRKKVRELSTGKQIPWENTSLEGDFYFHQAGQMPVNGSTGEPAGLIPLQAFTDARDGQTYRWVRIGDQIWMAENLAFAGSDSWCYDNSVRNCRIYGRLYTWEAALTACPEGWELPGDEDWKQLEVFLGMSETEANERYIRGEDISHMLKAAGTELWISSPDQVRDELGFSVLPGGTRQPDGIFYDLGTQAAFWTADEYYSMTAWSREIADHRRGINRMSIAKSIACSVRCIKKTHE